MTTRPGSYLGWVPSGSGSYITQPTTGQAATGVTSGQAFPYAYFNWLEYTTDQWLQFFDGIVTALAGANLTVGQVVYISVGSADGSRTAGRAYPCDSSGTVGSGRQNAVGIVMSSVSSGAAVSIFTWGIVSLFTSLIAGDIYYVDPTNPGGITASRPSNAFIVPIGIAVSTTQLSLSSRGNNYQAPSSLISSINPATQSPYVMSSTDLGKTFLVNTANGAMQFTLPVPLAGFWFVVKDSSGNMSVNNITMAQNAAENIEGLAASFIMAAAWGFYKFISDGTNWFLIT